MLVVGVPTGFEAFLVILLEIRVFPMELTPGAHLGR